jgi:pSer/pThr/pTyr-binding forkhead associated (FHA) protein
MPSPPLRPVTLVEPDPDLQWQLHALGPTPPPPPAAAPALAPAASDQGVTPYRPTHRPPVPLLTVCDDGQNDGQVIRIRGTQFTIGRTEGDLQLPADEMVSARHAEIVCQPVGGTYRWVVADLQSRNGLFLRVRRATLSDGTEFLVGQGRYRVEFPAAASPHHETVDQAPGRPVDGTGTRGWDPGNPDHRPMLIEVLPAGSGARIPLAGVDQWIGSDPGCAVCRAGDPFVSPRHVQIGRDPKGTWSIRNNGTANGLWVRMPQFVVARECAFQIGEQRFRLAVPA